MLCKESERLTNCGKHFLYFETEFFTFGTEFFGFGTKFLYSEILCMFWRGLEQNGVESFFSEKRRF